MPRDNTTTTHLVKHRNLTVTVYPWRHPSGREYWRFRAGSKHVTRATLDKAKQAAKEHMERVYQPVPDLRRLTPDQKAAVGRLLAADPTLAAVDEFLVWRAKSAPRVQLRTAEAEFLAAKREAAGSSPHNVDNLTRYLAKLPSMVLADIRPADLPALAGAARTRNNARAAWITFFRWCRARRYLPWGEPVAPEMIERAKTVAGVPETWSPAELRVLLANVRPAYLPWLALAAFAGLRTEEVIPQPRSTKIPLDWADFHWARGILIVRPETAKTGRRRVVPILPALAAWIRPVARESGRVSPRTHPSKPTTNGATAEVTRLGALVGGWRRNALRHSFISYRAAMVGIAQTAMEAGNSESESRRSYNDSKGADEAAEWFEVTP